MSFNPEKIKEIGTKLEEGLRDLRDDELFGAFPVVCQRLVEEMARAGPLGGERDRHALGLDRGARDCAS